jgi:hypothetical protein
VASARTAHARGGQREVQARPWRPQRLEHLGFGSQCRLDGGILSTQSRRPLVRSLHSAPCHMPPGGMCHMPAHLVICQRLVICHRGGCVISLLVICHRGALSALSYALSALSYATGGAAPCHICQRLVICHRGGCAAVFVASTRAALNWSFPPKPTPSTKIQTKIQSLDGNKQTCLEPQQASLAPPRNNVS